MGDDALQPRNPLRAQSNKFLPSAHHFPDSGLGEVFFFPPLIPFLGRPSSFLERVHFLRVAINNNSFCVRVLVHFSRSLNLVIARSLQQQQIERVSFFPNIVFFSFFGFGEQTVLCTSVVP